MRTSFTTSSTDRRNGQSESVGSQTECRRSLRDSAVRGPDTGLEFTQSSGRVAGKKLTSRKRRFIEEHGDAAVELDAIPPNDLRALIDSTISQHLPERELNALLEEQQAERELGMEIFQLGQDAREREREWEEREEQEAREAYGRYVAEHPDDDDSDDDAEGGAK